ncbi:hypothetical protein BATMR_15900 [Bacillus altitudinis]|nr:hypothetical protein BATMR_15900 [Bacillus altitudinis]
MEVSIHSDGGDFLNIRLLTPEDAQEYANLRLEALRLNPESFAMSYEEEKLDTKNKYKARFASTQSMWTFIKVSWSARLHSYKKPCRN